MSYRWRVMAIFRWSSTRTRIELSQTDTRDIEKMLLCCCQRQRLKGK